MSKLGDLVKEGKNTMISKAIASFIHGRLDKYLKGIPRNDVHNDIVVMADMHNERVMIHIVEIGKDNDVINIKRQIQEYKLSELIKMLMTTVNEQGGIDIADMINQQVKDNGNVIAIE